MPVYVSSFSATNRHGVFALERTPPASILPTGTGICWLVGQFSWGPPQKIFTGSSLKDITNTFAPPGMSRSGSGYLALIRKAFPTIRVTRVVASSGTVAASVALQAPGPITVATVHAKYVGTAGNSLTATVGPASDGDTNHFNLTVTVTGASGTTSDLIQNLNYSGVGANSAPDLSQALLVGSISFGVSGIPTAGTFSFASGADGTIASTDYVGTAGSGDKGFALGEGDTSIRHFFTDDPGNSFRAVVNAGGEAHAVLMGDRVFYTNGNSGQSASAAQTDVASYRSDRVVYCDPWCHINDDVAGSDQLVMTAPFAASVAAQLPTSTSIAWKNTEVVDGMLNGITALEFTRGQSAGDNTTAGITTFIQEATGGFSMEAGVLTIAPQDPSRRNLTRRRVGDLIAISFVNSTRGFVDGPNVPYNQDALVQALEGFMSTLKKAKDFDPNHKDHVLDYAIGDLSAANTKTDLANGLFIIPLQVQTSSGMEKIFLSIQFGENVTVVHAS